MLMRELIFRINGECEALDGRQVKIDQLGLLGLQLLDVDQVLFDSGEVSAECLVYKIGDRQDEEQDRSGTTVK